MDCISRSGDVIKIYDGTNVFCIKEFLKKDRSSIGRMNIVLNKEIALDTMFVKHLLKSSVNFYKLFQVHQDTLDYVLQRYPEYLVEVLNYVDEPRFYYIIQTYKPSLVESFEPIAKYGTPEILQLALNESKLNMKWFTKEWFYVIYKYGNIKLFWTCHPFIDPVEHIPNIIKFVNIQCNHLVFINYVIKIDALKKNHAINILSQTMDQDICNTIYKYYLTKKGLRRIIDIIDKTGNEIFFNRLLQLNYSISETMSNDDPVQTFIKPNIKVNRKLIHLSAVFGECKYKVKNFTVKNGQFEIVLKDWLRYRLSWLKSLPIRTDTRFIHMWKYIHDTYGWKTFLETFNELKHVLTLTISKLIVNTYPGLLKYIWI